MLAHDKQDEKGEAVNAFVDKPVVTRELLAQAVEIATPTIEKLLETPGMTWGPKWVEGQIRCQCLCHHFRVGEKIEWNPEWGEHKYFGDIANSKANTAQGCGTCTREVLHFAPHRFGTGEYRYVGAVHDPLDGIVVAVSGAYGDVDETIAKIIRDILLGLIYRACA